MEKYIKIATEQDCSMIKRFDDLCFGSHQGVSEEELHQVVKNGAIFLLFYGDELVGESQLVLNSFEGCHEFPTHCAYAYGTAIHPNHQGKGFGKILINEQEKFSRLSGKKVLHFTVRLENYASLKMRIDSGARITGYDRFYYGKNSLEDSRLILEKDLVENNHQVSYHNCKFVSVNFDKTPEEEKHNEISSIINQGYTGYSINRSGIDFGI